MSEDGDTQACMEQNHEREQERQQEFQTMSANLDKSAGDLYLALRAVEFGGEAKYYGGLPHVCGDCGGTREEGHTDGCRVGKAIDLAEGTIRKEIDSASRVPKKRIWTDGDELIVADSDLEAFLMSGYADFEEWEGFKPLSDDTAVAIRCDEAGNTAEDGKPFTRTAAEWCAREPKGHLASTYG